MRAALTRAVNPHAAAVERDKCQQQVFERHRIDALQGENHHANDVYNHPQQPVFDIFARHQNHRYDGEHHHAGVPEREGVRLQLRHGDLQAQGLHQRHGNPRQKREHRVNKYRHQANRHHAGRQPA